MSRRDEDLDALLSDLETTLGRLRSTLEEDAERGRGRRRPPRPPSPGELFRFTEEYTIPTIIAILEANVRALKLLQQVLRLADPARSVGEDARGLRERLAATETRGAAGVAGDVALDRLERSLEDLQTALSEANLPTDPNARSIVEDARTLSEEIERRIAESQHAGRQRTRRRDWSDGSERRGGVRIDVEDERPDEESGDADRRTAATGESDRPAADESSDADAESQTTVDVEDELETIREEVGREREQRDAGHVDEPGRDEGDEAGGDDEAGGGDGDEAGGDERPD
jgi:hypothetical protein